MTTIRMTGQIYKMPSMQPDFYLLAWRQGKLGHNWSQGLELPGVLPSLSEDSGMITKAETSQYDVGFHMKEIAN